MCVHFHRVDDAWPQLSLLGTGAAAVGSTGLPDGKAAPFAQPGKAANLMEWLRNGNTTIDIYGVTFPTYRLFVIFLGIVMFIFVTLLMTKTRLGMIIRAGVQDPQMVEALGINVKRVFTFVFAMGIALALGGIGGWSFPPIRSWAINTKCRVLLRLLSAAWAVMSVHLSGR